MSEKPDPSRFFHFTDALLLKVHTGNLAERPFELLETFRYLGCHLTTWQIGTTVS